MTTHKDYDNEIDDEILTNHTIKVDAQAEIERDIEAFFAAGGEIDVRPGFERTQTSPSRQFVISPSDRNVLKNKAN